MVEFLNSLKYKLETIWEHGDIEDPVRKVWWSKNGNHTIDGAYLRAWIRKRDSEDKE